MLQHIPPYKIDKLQWCVPLLKVRPRIPKNLLRDGGAARSEPFLLVTLLFETLSTEGACIWIVSIPYQFADVRGDKKKKYTAKIREKFEKNIIQ